MANCNSICFSLSQVYHCLFYIKKKKHKKNPDSIKLSVNKKKIYHDMSY